ncbi:hypothetical protein C8R43DRAFT_1105101 [Mycena crocata]|nr:hypothetical protein C8R43DRAFT_1105101 [Mycena crocata]
MPFFTPGPGLGPLSNRAPHYQRQSTLIVDGQGRLQYAALSRRILTLPPELLSEIFLHCLPDDEFISPDITTAPLLLCGVCRRFRNVALGTPELWSSLNMNFSEPEKDVHAEFSQLCKVWICRAQSTPLSLSLSYTDEVHDDDMHLIISMAEIIAHLSKQWQNLNIELDDDFVELALALPMDAKFPLLEKLTVTTLDSVAELPISFHDAPKLREVYLNRMSRDILLLPWQQITTFQVDDIPVVPCLKILRDAQNLVDGIFDIFDEDPSSSSTSMIPRMHLRSLSVLGTDVVDVIKCLKVPALTCLRLDLDLERETMETHAFLSFASRSSFHLHTLILNCQPTDMEALVQCLQAVPSLIHLKLRLQDVSDMNAIFASLTGQRSFLPKLESMHTIFIYPETDMQLFTALVLVEMLCWRWATVGIARLQSFQLVYTTKREPVWCKATKSHSEFLRLKKEGMTLYIGRWRHTIDVFDT